MSLDVFRDFATQWQDAFTIFFSIVAAVLAVYSYRSSRRSAAQADRAVQLSRRSLHVAANQHASELVLGIDHVLIEHPEVRPYLLGETKLAPVARGKPKSKRRNLVEAVAENQLDVMEAIWDHEDEFREEDREAWREWMHDLFQDSPILRETYKPGWYPSLEKMFASPCDEDKHTKAHGYAGNAMRGPLQALRDARRALEESTNLAGLQAVAEAEVIRLRPERAVVLAAAYAWQAGVGDAPGRGLHLLAARLRGSLPGLHRAPPLKQGLRSLLEEAKDSGEVKRGRRMSREQAVTYALGRV